MGHHVSFEAIETHLHKNIYQSYTMGDKDQNFRKHCKSFSMLPGELATFIKDWGMIQRLKQWLCIVEEIQRTKDFKYIFLAQS